MPAAPEHHQIRAHRNRAQNVEAALDSAVEHERQIRLGTYLGQHGETRRRPIKLSPAMVRNPDRIDPGLFQWHHILRIKHALHDQFALPFLAHSGQIFPIRHRAQLIARVIVERHAFGTRGIIIDEAHARHTVRGHGHGPCRTDRDLGENARCKLGRLREARADLAFPSAGRRKIGREHGGVKPGLPGAAQHVATHLRVARWIELKPGVLPQRR